MPDRGRLAPRELERRRRAATLTKGPFGPLVEVYRRIRGGKGRGVLLFEDMPCPEGRIARAIHSTKDGLLCRIDPRGWRCPYSDQLWHQERFAQEEEPPDEELIRGRVPLEKPANRRPTPSERKAETWLEHPLGIPIAFDVVRRAAMRGRGMRIGRRRASEIERRSAERLQIRSGVFRRGTGRPLVRGRGGFSFDPTRRMAAIVRSRPKRRFLRTMGSIFERSVLGPSQEEG